MRWAITVCWAAAIAFWGCEGDSGGGGAGSGSGDSGALSASDGGDTGVLGDTAGSGGGAPSDGTGWEVHADTAVVIDTPCACTGTGTSLENLACAIDLCDESVLLSQQYDTPNAFSACTLEETRVALERFGDPDNGLAPIKNGSYALLATGPANRSDRLHSFDCSRSDRDPGVPDPVVPHSGAMYDTVEWTLELAAPPGAQGFRFSYVFFSEEYDDYISSPRNDKFYVILNAPVTTGGKDVVINVTDCRDPFSYYDFGGEECGTPSGFCCYIAVNSAASDCCWYPAFSQWVDNAPSLTPCAGTSQVTTNIAGTGFECAQDAASDGDTHGSSTGWLQTSWRIAPEEKFRITFHLHDTADGYYDSAVLIDAFEFVGSPPTNETVEIILL